MIAEIDLIMEQCLAIGGLVDASNHIECRRFSSTVRADEGDDLSLVHLQGEVIYRHHAAKLHGDIF